MKLAIIGGSLTSNIREFSDTTEKKHVPTPYGEPSDACITARINGIEIVYLNRHGNAHNIAPHLVNYRANMFMLKELEVSHIVSMTAVGGITEKMSPMQWVVPDQIIDYTYGREHSFNDINQDAVKHIDFSYPFDSSLRKKLREAVKMEKLYCLSRGTYGVMQGPRLETVAEINRMERDGCDIVGMTVMPEASLARELEMNYATLSLVVNWAAGKSARGTEDAGIVSIEDIQQLMAKGSNKLENIIRNLLEILYV